MKPILLLALLALLAACGKAKPDQDAAPTALVTTALAAQAGVADTATAYGAAEFNPDGERTLAAPVEAVVVQVLAPAGTRVGVGQAVLVLKQSATSQLDLNKAQADASAATAAYARAQRLRASGLDSDADVETARAASAAAEATAKSLAGRAGGALTLRSPIDGVVESVASAPGDQVAQGAAVAKVGALAGLRVRLGLEPRDAATVRAGATVRLSPLAGGAEQAAKVSAIDPRVDAQTRLASVLVAAAGGAFAPGEPLKGVILLRQEAAATVIPRAALLYDQEQPYVFVVVKSAAHRRNVALGADDGDKVAITQGLSSGERIVVDGASALDDNMAVREGKAATAGADGGL